MSDVTKERECVVSTDDCKDIVDELSRLTVSNDPRAFLLGQSLRPSILASKTRTRSRFGAATFFAHLSATQNDEKTDAERKEKTTDKGKKGEALVSRGPIRGTGCCLLDQTHPYASVGRGVQMSIEKECPEMASPVHTPLILQSNARLLTMNQLPDALSDFILKYSRHYSSSPDLNSECSPASRKSSCSESTAAEPSLSVTSKSVDSPASAKTVSHCSSDSPTSENDLTRRCQTRGKAKERVRSLISEEELAAAWAWTCKCTRLCPAALYYRDPDGDSLLHIVVSHKDLAKSYALVEQMIKLPFACGQRPFDWANRWNETPLFLAVQQRCPELVAYLLETGANANIQTSRPESDSVLHYAAARGMTEIVGDLIEWARDLDVDIVNGRGLTPLLCAVSNHGALDEDSRCLVNNKPSIRALFNACADPFIQDATDGKTIVHYAVERMDPELIEIFKWHMDEDGMRRLVNMADWSGETPLQLLSRLQPVPYSQLLHTLLKSGASLDT